MKVAFLCCVLLLAGSASCSPAEAQSLPDWLPDINITIPEWIIDLIARLPESIQEFIDRLPEIVAAIPGIIEQLPEIIAQIIEKIPEVIPIILDKLPEIIAQIPEVLEKIRAVIEQIIEKLPELIPVILDKIPEIIAAIPEIVDKIKEVLENLDLPDWFPNLPELDKPEWWPVDLPSLPEYNPGVPGTLTTVEDYPSIVQIEVGTRTVWTQGCAGTVLTNLHIISCARCFSGRSYADRFRRVRAGSSSRNSGGFVSEVASVINHPSFNGLESDLSVIRLASSLTLGSTIQQSPIVASGFTLPAGLSVVTAGWGTTAQGKRFTDAELYAIDLVSVDETDCQQRWGRRFAVQSDQICVGHSETGGRNGDIRDMGAPIYYDNVLVGITSVGAPFGNQYFPVVATKVSEYTLWIIENAV